MSHSKSLATESSENSASKPSNTPLTRTCKVTKKRGITSTVGDEADDLLDMDVGCASREQSISPMRQFNLDSPSPVQSDLPAQATFAPLAPPHARPMASLTPPSCGVPSLASRPRAPDAGFRSAFNNLPTCIRLMAALPPGRMDLVQTGIKMELAILNLPRAAVRGLEDYVNERAAGFHQRVGYTVERIKLYSQAGEVVLFGKVGTAYDVRALHHLFRDIAAGSNLRYCSNTFPDLTTGVENARPWFNQGEVHQMPHVVSCIVH